MIPHCVCVGKARFAAVLTGPILPDRTSLLLTLSAITPTPREQVGCQDPYSANIYHGYLNTF